MATISLCMIVKNEEKLLRRCLDSVHDLVDEIVIVDTGSNDLTKEIASEYTDKIFDFEWIDDFSAARNFSFSKCSMDYIYVADADEYLDDENRFQFTALKDNLYPEIEIVQMMYETISHDTVLNVYKEYRPKLFKRLREFTWINPVHETVRLDPLVFDSDVVVTHDPDGNHAKRDFSIFEKVVARDGSLPDDLLKMYATELYKNGSVEDFEKAASYFVKLEGEISFTPLEYYSIPISVKRLRITNDSSFEDYTLCLLDVVSDGQYNELSYKNISEVCYELGEYYIEKNEYDKAYEFFKKAYEGESILDIHTSGDYAIKRLIHSCEKVIEQYNNYKNINGSDDTMEKLLKEFSSLREKYVKELSDWKMPEEIPV